jgi:hypothetical protein
VRFGDRVENQVPYSLFGDNNGAYKAGLFSEGWNWISAYPYSEDDAGGYMGPNHLVYFNVIPSAEEEISLILVDTKRQEDVLTIEDREVIDLSKVGTDIGIRADIPGGTTSKVNFNLTGPFNHTQSEGILGPWGLFGDVGTIINPWPLGGLLPGDYTLTVQTNRTTNTVTTKTVNFTLVSNPLARLQNPFPDNSESGMPQILSVYPNPVSGNNLRVLLSSPMEGAVTFSVSDLTGKLVQFEEQAGQQRQLFDVRLSEGLAPGVYLLEMKSHQHQLVWHERFIKAQ